MRSVLTSNTLAHQVGAHCEAAVRDIGHAQQVAGGNGAAAADRDLIRAGVEHAAYLEAIVGAARAVGKRIALGGLGELDLGLALVGVAGGAAVGGDLGIFAVECHASADLDGLDVEDLASEVGGDDEGAVGDECRRGRLLVATELPRLTETR